MTDLPAHCVFREFPAEDRKVIQFPQHYLLYADKGTMRLEADGRSWTLPPARAAFIAADAPIAVTIAHPITCCSALFSPDHFDPPKGSLSVFSMSPLARELILAARAFGPETPKLSNEARQIFDTLCMVARNLANDPIDTWMPIGTSHQTRQAMELTENHLADEVTFSTLAKTVGSSERTLARKFQTELGMTWRQAQRRLRMIHAIEKLALPDQSITQIAQGVGYGSSSAFNAAFLDFTGRTPSDYRRAVRGEALE